jgi:hypothetical protein
MPRIRNTDFYGTRSESSIYFGHKVVEKFQKYDRTQKLYGKKMKGDREREYGN